ncbi:hypothetical protein PR048_017703 [Dryococelus australis]|uniref:Uncharacterized protein n=1 Tax=Dryococelus australis TaxID=614101 RepID=A0ABQ9HAC1_9NEOP|nr:hypothetical protein PR048_017703 [Dryococelus australis]
MQGLPSPPPSAPISSRHTLASNTWQGREAASEPITPRGSNGAGLGIVDRALVHHPGSIPGGISQGFRMWGNRGLSRGSPIRPTLAFRLCSISNSPHPHRLSRPRCSEPPKPLHLTALNSTCSDYIAQISTKKLNGVAEFLMWAYLFSDWPGARLCERALFPIGKCVLGGWLVSRLPSADWRTALQHFAGKASGAISLVYAAGVRVRSLQATFLQEDPNLCNWFGVAVRRVESGETVLFISRHIHAPFHPPHVFSQRWERPSRRGAHGVVVRLLASHQGEKGSVSGGVARHFRKWESCRTMPLVGVFFFLCRLFTSPSSALKTDFGARGADCGACGAVCAADCDADCGVCGLCGVSLVKGLRGYRDLCQRLQGSRPTVKVTRILYGGQYGQRGTGMTEHELLQAAIPDPNSLGQPIRERVYARIEVTATPFHSRVLTYSALPSARLVLQCHFSDPDNRTIAASALCNTSAETAAADLKSFMFVSLAHFTPVIDCSPVECTPSAYISHIFVEVHRRFSVAGRSFSCISLLVSRMLLYEEKLPLHSAWNDLFTRACKLSPATRKISSFSIPPGHSELCKSDNKSPPFIRYFIQARKTNGTTLSGLRFGRTDATVILLFIGCYSDFVVSGFSCRGRRGIVTPALRALPTAWQLRDLNSKFHVKEISPHEVSMEQRWNARAGEMGDLRENPPTSGIVRHNSHMRILGRPRRESKHCSPWREASSLTTTPPRPHLYIGKTNFTRQLCKVLKTRPMTTKETCTSANEIVQKV